MLSVVKKKAQVAAKLIQRLPTVDLTPNVRTKAATIM